MLMGAGPQPLLGHFCCPLGQPSLALVLDRSRTSGLGSLQFPPSQLPFVSSSGRMRRDIPVSTSYLIWHLRQVVGASPLRKVIGEDGAGLLAHCLPHRGYGLIRNNPNNKCGYGAVRITLFGRLPLGLRGGWRGSRGSPRHTPPPSAGSLPPA